MCRAKSTTRPSSRKGELHPLLFCPASCLCRNCEGNVRKNTFFAADNELQQCVQAKQPVPASVKVKVVQCVGQQGRVPKIKLTCLGVSLEINLTHYNKLRLLHAHASGDTEHHETTFCQHAMALLLRYSSLQGTHYRGGGFQVCTTHCHSNLLCNSNSTTSTVN